MEHVWAQDGIIMRLTLHLSFTGVSGTVGAAASDTDLHIMAGLDVRATGDGMCPVKLNDKYTNWRSLRGGGGGVMMFHMTPGRIARLGRNEASGETTRGYGRSCKRQGRHLLFV